MVYSILGLVFTLIGYYISYELRYENSFYDNPFYENTFLNNSSMGLFDFSLIVVLFVIIGTFFIFQGLINKIFNILQKSDNFYKRSKNFIFISNLSNRLRENAVSLAIITILSCMILVTLSMCIFANIGFLGQNEPFHINLYTHENSKLNILKNTLEKT